MYKGALMKRFFSMIAAIILLLPFVYIPEAKAVNFPLSTQLKSESAILVNLDADIILHEKNPDTKRMPGPLVNIMTAVIVLEECPDLNKELTLDPEVYTPVYNEISENEYSDDLPDCDLCDGDVLTINDLLYCMMLTSSVEASQTLAYHVGGDSVTAFVEKMNNKAAELGMDSTHFTNPTGMYDENQYTTARDMATLTRYALSVPLFETIATTYNYTPVVPNPERHKHIDEWVWSHSNVMMDPDSTLYYMGAKGIKTANLMAAGRNIIALASKDGDATSAQESAQERSLPSRGTLSQPPKAPSARIRDVVCEAVDPAQARLRIVADGVLKPQVSMMRNQPMLVIDMPGAVLETSAMAWRFSHPLVSEVQAVADAAPGLARLLVSVPRLVTYRVIANPPDGYEIALRLPRLTGRRLEEMTVVIDPGHGGPSATGCSAVYEGTRVYEKNLTLKIGRKVYDQLRATGMNVIMTRSDDVAVNLGSRPALANTNLADLFVSIHVDDFPGNPRASGTTAYYHGSDENSRALAHVLASTVSAAAGVPNRGARSDMERFKTGMAVLRSAEMPAVLLEVAYISNPEDRAKLMREDCLNAMARAIAEGIRSYVEAKMPGLEPAQLDAQ